MPVLLDEKTTKMWLDPSVPYAECYKSILESNIIAKGDDIDMYEVSPLVNKVSNQSADCILPKTQLDEKSFNKGIGRFFQKKSGPSTVNVEELKIDVASKNKSK